MLPEADFPRGNVRRDLRGHSLEIGPVAADRIPRGRRGQRPGLLYDESAPGFIPSKWPFVSVPSPDNAGTRFVLGGEREGMRSTVVDVAYRHVDTRMARLHQPLELRPTTTNSNQPPLPEPLHMLFITTLICSS